MTTQPKGESESQRADANHGQFYRSAELVAGVHNAEDGIFEGFRAAHAFAIPSAPRSRRTTISSMDGWSVERCSFLQDRNHARRDRTSKDKKNGMMMAFGLGGFDEGIDLSRDR